MIYLYQGMLLLVFPFHIMNNNNNLKRIVVSLFEAKYILMII